MEQKLRVIKVIGFIADDVRIQGNNRTLELYLPLSSIAYLTKVEQGNPRSDYDAHFDVRTIVAPYPLKSVNTVRLKKEEVELVGLSD